MKYFGKDGREEAQALLERQSGQQDNPRILGAFNERTPDWLSFFMFTYFTDRDGKMQLAALAESGFDPLSRTCRFMLTEEAHHMFVGETGVQRTIEATCAAMVKAGVTDPNDVEAVRKLGVVDLPLLQRKANFHISVTRDLFGSEISSNAAEAFSSGIKGRFNEANLKGDDHVLQDATYGVTRVVDGKLVEEQVPALRAINSRLLDDYIADCQGGVERWNKVIEKAGIAFKFVSAAQRVQPQDRRVRGQPHQPRGRGSDGGAMAGRERPLAAQRRRHGFHRLADEAVPRARQIRELDRAAARRRQQPARRLRICEDLLSFSAAPRSLRDAAALLELGDDSVRESFRALLGGVENQLRGLGRFVRLIDAGEILDLARERALVEALRVARDDGFERSPRHRSR